MLVVGLTGGIATGKSTVSSILKSHNIPIIDADIIAREVVLPGTPALRAIVKTFGQDVLFSSGPDAGSLDRKKLGSIIFPDPQKRQQLNAIVHPAVRRAMFWQVIQHWLRGEKWCVVDVPLLIEGPLWKLVGLVVVVYCPTDIQLQRLMLRDKSTLADASARLGSQIPIAEKAEYADIVIDNSATTHELEEQAVEFIGKMNKKTRGARWLVGWLIPPVGVLLALWTLARRNWFSGRKITKHK